MNFLCPSCKARYKISDEKLSGRARARMSCKRCGTVIELLREAEGQFVVNSASASGPVSNSLIPQPANPPALGLRGAESLMPDPDTLPVAEDASLQQHVIARHEDARALASLIAGAAVSVDREWFIGVDGQVVGPLTEETVGTRAQSGRINAQTLVWHDGLDDWQPLSSFPELAAKAGDLDAAIELPPPSQPRGRRVRMPRSWVPQRRSRSALSGTVAIVLGAFACGAVGFLWGRQESGPIIRYVDEPAAPAPVEAAAPPVQSAAAGPAGGASAGGAAGAAGEGVAVAGGGVAGGGREEAGQPQPLASQEAERVVRQRSPQVHRICGRTLGEQGSLAREGVRVNLHLLVGEDGKVKTSQSDAPDDAELGRCVEQQATSWIFPESSEAVRIDVPFEFASLRP